MRILRFLSIVTLTGALLAPARADVRSVTLGITMNCPYGLAG